MTLRKHLRHGMVGVAIAAVLAGAVFVVRPWLRGTSYQSAYLAKAGGEFGNTPTSEHSAQGLDLSRLSPHLATAERKELLAAAWSESLSHYLSGSEYDVQMFVHQSVLQSSEPPNTELIEGLAKFHSWFWSSLKLREGDSQVYPIVLAGVPQPSPAIDGENHSSGRRKTGLACHDEPIASQYCYEVQTPIEYVTPDGITVKARLGLYYQWSESGKRWVQSGVSLYGFPAGQPIFTLPG